MRLFTKAGAAREEDFDVRTARGVARGVALLAVAFVIVSWFLAGNPSTAEREKAGDEQDYPEIFRDVSIVLKHAYLDLDRMDPRDLIERAFGALENAVDEIYVESTPDLEPYVALHLESKVQVFDLEAVTSLDGAVTMLENVFLFVKRNYQGDQELNDIRYAAVNGLLSGLDPHTMVFSPKAFEDFSVHIEGEIYGVGMYVGSRDGKLTVIEVLKDTPAMRAGFKKGDLIAKIGDESTINMTVTEAVEEIRGPRKSWVTLTVKRAKAGHPDQLETLEIPVQRDRVVIKSVESKLLDARSTDAAGPWTGGVGYVKVVNFDKNTTSSLREHLDRLREENGGKPLGSIVLDLRGNSGGLLTQAVEMSDLFLESGSIVVTATKGNRFYYQEAKDNGDEPECPLIVLSDEGSASGAEIVIGALQRNNRALVLGTRTFGKGSVQQLHRLRNGAQLKITVSEYLLPGKVSIQETGVVPDIHAKPVVLNDEGLDLFPNERSMTEKDYEQHIVSKFATKEVPSFTLDYYFEPPDDDIYSDRFVSGELEPEKDKLVAMGLDLLGLAAKPFDAKAILESKAAAIHELKKRLFDEIVAELGERGIDWTYGDDAPSEVAPDSLDLALSTRFTQEPSGDPEDPVKVHHLIVAATLTNRGTAPIYRVKGLSRSDFFLYKDREFLFGKLDPGQSISREVKIRLPYFPTARNDLFTVEVSSTPRAPGWEEADEIVLSSSIPVELEDRGRPAFAYSAELLDARDPKNPAPIRSLREGMEATMHLRIQNRGDAPVYKGVAILRNETKPRRQIFLRKGRIEFPAVAEAAETKTTIGAEGVRAQGDAEERQDPESVLAEMIADRAASEPIPALEPGETVEVEFSFEVRAGDPVEFYEFDLAIVDSYSNASLVRRLKIPSGDKEDLNPFPNGLEFVPPVITAVLKGPSSEAGPTDDVLVTERDRVLLDANIKSQDGTTLKAWIFNTHAGDHELPDKIFFVDSKGEPKLDVTTAVPLKKGTNLFTVVARDRNDLETRQSVVVRRE